MEKTLGEIIEYLLPQADALLYLFLFLSAVAENLFPPIPGDTVTAFGAFLVGTGRLDYFAVFAVTTAGSLLGFMGLFYAGRFLGREFFEKRNYSFFSSSDISAAQKKFTRYGYLIVLANRFMPGIRSVISLSAGMSGLNSLKVCGLALLSAAVWNLIWIHAGYTIGGRWETASGKIAEMMGSYNLAAGIIIGLIALAIIALVIKKKISSLNKRG